MEPETKIIDINLHRANGDVETLRVEVPADKHDEYIENYLKAMKDNPYWKLARLETHRK